MSVVGVPSRFSQSQPYSLMITACWPSFGHVALRNRVGRGQIAQAGTGDSGSDKGVIRGLSPGSCGGIVAVVPRPIGEIEPADLAMAGPVSGRRVSLLASQITTHGWFQRSRIHSAYSAADLVASLRLPVISRCRSQIGNSSWIRMPSSSAMSYHASGGKPMQ